MSTQDTPSPHARLRELAEKATPGPWENSRGFVRTKQGNPGGGNTYASPDGRMTIQTGCSWVAECRNGEAFYNPDGNANYIAAANPQVVIGLLDEIERLRADHRLVIRDALEDRAASLEAKLREAEAREAVMVERLTEFHERCRIDALMSGPVYMGFNSGSVAGRSMADLWRDTCAALSSPSAAASALVTRLADLENLRVANEAILSARHVALTNALNRVAELESELAAARQNARTPGALQACGFCHARWEGAATGCGNELCPIRTASSPQAGEGT